MPPLKSFDTRAVSNSRPTDANRGLSNAREVPDESELERWIREQGYAADFVPFRRDRPAPREDPLDSRVRALGDRLDFTPTYDAREPPPPKPPRGGRNDTPLSSGRAGTVEGSELQRRLERWIPEAANTILSAFVRGGRTADAFVGNALGQKGHPYDQETAAAPTELNPEAFDCSSLVRWAAARQKVNLPRTAAQQLAAMQSAGATVSVETAIHTRGALLFHSGHVAISLGNGRTIEAMGKKWGVREGGTVVHNKDGTQRPRFTEGALIPLLRY